MRLIVRPLAQQDYKPYKKIFDQAYYEYLEDLKRNNPQQYHKEVKDKRKVTRFRFNFYLRTGSSFVAEKDGEVVAYVATQTIHYMRGHDRVLWIEYVVTKHEHRQQGMATALLRRLVDYAKRHRINSIYATINPDNAASVKLHQKLGFDVRNWITASLQARQ